MTQTEPEFDMLVRSLCDVEGARHKLDCVPALARDLAGRFELQPLLGRILGHATSLLGCESGSIALVNETSGTYTKKVDIGVGCQEGQTFSLKEGFTGQIVRSRSTLILEAYSSIERGHIPATDPRWNCAVIGVPIRWGEQIIGAFIVFSPDQGRKFNPEEARLAELFASHAAIALANSDLHAQASIREREAAVAAERERAVRDVHETVGRSLAALLLCLDEAEKASRLDGGEQTVTPHLGKARTIAHDALTETRRTVLGMGPAALAGRTLVDAIAGELAWVESMSGTATQLTVIGEARALAPEIEHHAFRIVQEALHNVVTHARAISVRAGLIYDAGTLAVVVEDNGQGFDLAAAHGAQATLPAGCLGLHGMSSRAIHLGGNLHIDTTPGWGTKVRASLPDRAPEPAASGQTHWKILIANDHPLITAGLVRLLSIAEPAIQVTAEVSSAEKLFDALELLRPDVLLVDLDMVYQNATGVLTGIRQLDPRVAIVVLTDNPTAEQVRSARHAGVRGFVNRRASGETIARVLVAAGQGQALVEGEVFDRLMGSPSPESGSGTNAFTAREKEVHDSVVLGMADKQIARELGISVKTIEKHVGSILRKAGVRNRTMLAAMSGGESAPAHPWG
ncbi:GAF domain-containing protein [Arthrobacter sp. H14-L1]|uniref:hybrid sensor histidine kinase/response regulator transcription factor n=1 Tax=Arthrobacter sp. H14-L1 TaxID=2996697 RepID=UPI00226DF19F|nr:GAF domain-containing protein [Arthrobacter sp. H14-L1]MCY0905904.1 GAF domain-containing protein [Arthrobacter sp. H14-L1]